LENNTLFSFQNDLDKQKIVFPEGSSHMNTYRDFKHQKGYRLMKLFEKQSTECLKEDEMDPSLLFSSTNKDFDQSKEESLDDTLNEFEEFETKVISLSKTTRHFDVPFNIWQWKHESSYSGLAFF